MENPLRRPEEILAFRSLRQILATKPKVLWTVAPADTVLTAVQIMVDKDIGLLAVIDGGTLAGVLSERDCARRVLLAKKSPESTLVADVMVRNVVTIDVGRTFADCLRLMHQHGIRHLPVVDNGKVITVVSIRDLLGEAVTHHAKIIEELERERLTIFTSTA
ncbi:MAG TPA: CBS domain-containing protein [Bradyrhizobium sp.]|jgi:CBS domain-containing protein|nr:CBS domain-containing protein [Bradyrhizobium sp.]